MIIQFNTDNNVSGGEKVTAPITALISEQLNRYKDHITRIEVHLSDENGPKEGPNDIRCLLEARIERRQPIAVTNNANTYELAITGATEKLIASLDKIADRLKHQLKG
ncbi:MAG: HPF/RaiA family ribosome-associated protein [Bacteroidales bacterium]|nr:HPF/RaiA family ribosome-associated protein [Bacteroidales bacterium]